MKKIEYSDNWKTEYIACFSNEDINIIQEKWDWAVDIFPELLVFPNDIKKILVADFSQLTDWYFDYQKLINRNKNIENILKDKSSSELLIFDYKAYYPQIIKYFCNSNHLLNLESCYYCEIHPVGEYDKTGDDQRLTADLDHFFPKAQCPILALSLRNFVPSCQVCNSRIKSRTDFKDFYGIENTSSETEQKKLFIHLSPSSDDYSFETCSHISVWPTSFPGRNISFLKNSDIFNVHFSVTNCYSKEIRAFLLGQRYNSKPILAEALSILDLKQRFPTQKIIEIKKLMKKGNYPVTEEQIEEVIFRKEFDQNRYCNLQKLKRDLLE